MQTVSLSGSLRENVGKNDASVLRQNGKVPCVVYGGEKQHHIAIDHIALEKLIFSPNVYFIELEFGGEKMKTAIKDIQFHPVTEDILHVDFQRLYEDREIKLEIPVRLEGSAIGVRNGGRLAAHFRRLLVRALPQNLPDSIDLDVTTMRIGMSIRVKDLASPDFTILQDPNAVVVAVRRGRLLIEEEEDLEAEEGEEGEEGEGAAAAEGEGEGGGEAEAEESKE